MSYRSVLMLRVIKLCTACVLLQRLENQINDITELHQHEVTNNTGKAVIDSFMHFDIFSLQVGELRANLAQMESMTMGKSQDLEEAMETCQAKVNTHQLMI